MCYNGKVDQQGPLVNRLRRRPLTAKWWVRFPHGSPKSKRDARMCIPFAFWRSLRTAIEPRACAETCPLCRAKNTRAEKAACGFFMRTATPFSVDSRQRRRPACAHTWVRQTPSERVELARKRRGRFVFARRANERIKFIRYSARGAVL